MYLDRVTYNYTTKNADILCYLIRYYEILNPKLNYKDDIRSDIDTFITLVSSVSTILNRFSAAHFKSLSDTSLFHSWLCNVGLTLL